MSNESEDSDDELATDLQPTAETTSTGPETARSEPTSPDASTPDPAGPDSATVSQSRPTPAVDGESSLVFCAHCQTAVDPKGRGLCPVCGRFLPANTVSLVTGLRSKKLAKIVDAYRVDLIEQLFAERGGRGALDVVSRIAIENFALVCAQHKTIETRLDQDGLFTQTGRRRSAFDMLKGISETIDRLRTELPPILTRPTPTSADYSAMTDDQVVAHAERVLEMARLVARAREPEPLLTTPDGIYAPTMEVPEPPSSAVAPEPLCSYCHQSITRCAEIKTTRLDAWQALHHNDPSEIERREKAATDEMFASLERQRRGGDPYVR
jgi:hypothetical protein